MTSMNRSTWQPLSESSAWSPPQHGYLQIAIVPPIHPNLPDLAETAASTKYIHTYSPSPSPSTLPSRNPPRRYTRSAADDHLQQPPLNLIPPINPDWQHQSASVLMTTLYWPFDLGGKTWAMRVIVASASASVPHCTVLYYIGIDLSLVGDVGG